MANDLISLGRSFKNTGKINLSSYNTFCDNLISYTQNIQAYLLEISQHVQRYVMVEGSWYDDCAAAFARWWNDISGSLDGVDCLNRISTEVEELFETVGSSVCRSLALEKTTSESIGKRSDCEWIKKIASTDKYNFIRDLKKKDFGEIAQTECKAGTETIADENSLRALSKFVGSDLQKIDEKIDEIRKGVLVNLLETSIIIPNFDKSVLNRKVNTIKNRLDVIQTKLYEQLSKDLNYINHSSDSLRSALSTEFKKVTL